MRKVFLCPVSGDADYLMQQYGIYVQPINCPTAPKGTERLRFTPGPLQRVDDIEHLFPALEDLWKHRAISNAAA